MIKVFISALLIIMSISISPATANDFQSWVQNDLRNAALSAGVNASVFDREAQTIVYIPRVIELDRKQPEKKIGFDEYQAKTFTQSRINQGREHLRNHASLLNQIERQYGVPKEFIVSLWGMETSYGKNTGGFDILSSLATLAYDGRRGAYFQDELIKAFKILQGGHIDRDNFKGSWAGAMGQVQFMPTSWKAYAVDYNGDGHKDIWTTKADAFASAANYLKNSGWNYNVGWGREVRASGISDSMMDRKIRKSASEWARLGVRDADGSSLPNLSGNYYLVKPRGSNGKVFMGSENLATIMKWNNSNFFAVTVAELADALGGKTQRQSTPAIQSPTQSGRVISNRPDLIPHYNN